MEKTKLLTIAVIGLLVLNLGTLGFLVLSGPHGHRPPRDGEPKPQQIISEKLHFDENQKQEYSKLIEGHKSQIRVLQDQFRNTKNKLYVELSKPEVNVATKDSLINLLATTQKQIEIVHFKHFEDIKKLCHKEQLNDYNNLTQELSRIFGQQNHPPRPQGPPGHPDER